MDKSRTHICVIHRYPISQAVATNPSFSLFLKKLLTNHYNVTFVSFKELNRSFEVDGVNHIELGIEINRAKFLYKLIGSIMFSFRVPFIIRKINRRRRIDLVYCDDSFPFYGFFIKKITGLSTIIRLGDLQSAYMFAQRGFIRNSIFKFIFFFERRTWTQVDNVIPISNAFSDFLAGNRIPKDRLDVVPESIDLEGFVRKPGNLPIRNKYCINNSILVMFHGLFSPIKGVDILLRAAEKVIKSFPNIKFMLVGAGEDLYKLKKLSQALKIEENTIFTGWIPLSEIPEYIHACDIGVPLRNSNLGNNFVVTTALLQYWAMKKPVVLPRLQAMTEIVQGTKLEKFLFQPDSPDDLSNKIKALLSKSTSEKDSLGIEGYKLASRYFNIESVSQNMVQVLERYLNGKS